MAKQKKTVFIYSKNGSNDFDKSFVKKPLTMGQGICYNKCNKGVLGSTIELL